MKKKKTMKIILVSLVILVVVAVVVPLTVNAVLDSHLTAPKTTLQENDAWKNVSSSLNPRFPLPGNPDLYRDEIGSIQFAASLDGVPVTAWDVSQKQNGSVKAWVTGRSDGLYDLHFAGDGVIYLPADSRHLFSYYTNATEINFNNAVNTEKVTTMFDLFAHCESVTALDLSCFNTEKVHDMSSMFSDCKSLTDVNLFTFNTQNVYSFSSMFSDCESLTSVNLSRFNTQNATTFMSMFEDCASLTAVNLSYFDTSKAEQMSDMFKGCQALTSLDLSGFHTQNVTDMAFMFFQCGSLESLDLTSFDTQKVTEMNCMFAYCTNLQIVRVSKQFSIPGRSDSMFEGCPAGNVTIQ